MTVMNGIPFPGITSQAPVGEENLLYSTQGLKKIGLTFAQDAAAGTAGVVPAGTVVARVTASKLGAVYSDGDSPAGVGTAIGILLDTIDISAGPALGNVAYGGSLLAAALTGLDANALADLNGRKVTFGSIEVLVF